MSLMSERLKLAPAADLARDLKMERVEGVAASMVERDRINAIQAAVRWLARNGHRPAAEAFENFLLAAVEEERGGDG